VVQAQGGTAALQVGAYAAPGGTAYHFIMVSNGTSGGNEAIANLFSSFRFLSPAQTASLRPRVIRTVQVQPGETLDRLATRMASDRPLELFLTLNGRTRDDPLRPGDMVKIVTYPQS
jgi:predicted Zn-dependent protease